MPIDEDHHLSIHFSVSRPYREMQDTNQYIQMFSHGGSLFIVRIYNICVPRKMSSGRALFVGKYLRVPHGHS